MRTRINRRTCDYCGYVEEHGDSCVKFGVPFQGWLSVWHTVDKLAVYPGDNPRQDFCCTRCCIRAFDQNNEDLSQKINKQ